MPANVTRFGPGTLTLSIGEGTPVEVDASCQLANAVVAVDKDTDDDITVLCGDVVSGSVTYTATLSGTMLQDLAAADGIVEFTWTHKGEVADFEYTPTTAAGTTVTGQLTVDPLDIGTTDDYGVVMQSDFEWDCVGVPSVTFGVPVP